MMSPSPMVLINLVDIYAGVPGQDADGAPQFSYPAVTQQGVPCSAQPVVAEEIVDQDRLYRQTTWKFLFGGPTGVKNKDKLVHTDSAGVLHTSIAHIEQDQAGRGSAYVVYATERV